MCSGKTGVGTPSDNFLPCVSELRQFQNFVLGKIPGPSLSSYNARAMSALRHGLRADIAPITVRDPKQSWAQFKYVGLRRLLPC